MANLIEAWTLLPDAYWTVFTAILGLLIGSFTNVVVARLPEGKSIVSPPSACPKCSRRIRWYENVPVISYLALRGRCAGCRNPISVRYPIIEILTAILFVAAKQRFGVSLLLLIRDFPFMFAMVAITFIDLEHRIIPDELSLGGLVLGLATAYFVPGLGLLAAVEGAALGFGLFYGLAWGYYKLSGRSGLGGGDVKLLAMLGAFVGPSGVMTTLLISSISGSIIGIAWGFYAKRQASNATGGSAATRPKAMKRLP